MKKTTEQFVNEVYSITANEYTVLGQYINSKTKIKMRHNTCGHEWEVKPNGFIGGTRCPKCAGNQRLTTDEYKSKVYKVVSDEYEVLGNYINSQTKIKIRHNACGYEYDVVPSAFLSGNRCPKCSNRIPITTEDFKLKVYDLVGDEYIVLSEYKGKDIKVSIKHNICGTIYNVVPKSFLRGIRCPKCAGVMKSSTKEFKSKVKDLTCGEYSVIGEYLNNKTKIEIKHNVCGNTYLVKPNVFLSGCRCPFCAPNRKYTHQSFLDKVYELTGEKYTVLGKYKNSSTKILMRHNVCKSEFETKPNTFISGHGCPICFRSDKYTTDEFKNKIYDLVKDRYLLIGEYVNANTKIKLRHNPCGTEYEVLPFNFLNGTRCPKCSLQLKRSLPEEVVAYFLSKHFKIEQSFRPEWLKYKSGFNGEIDIWIPELNIGIEYDGKEYHKEEKQERDIIKNNMLSQSPNCKKLIRIREYGLPHFDILPKNVEIIEATGIISLTSKRGIEILEIIITKLLNSLGVPSPKVKITDDIINCCQLNMEDYYVSEGLPIRSKKQSNRKSNTKIYKKRVYNLVGDEYTVLSEYEYAQSKIKMRHNTCGYEYETKPSYFLSGRRCPRCAGHKKLTTTEYKSRVYKLVQNEYSVLGEYINTATKIKMKHEKCGHVWEVRPYSFIAGSRCPKCYKETKTSIKNQNIK